MLGRPQRRLIALDRIVEQDHQPVAGKLVQRAFVLVDQRAEAGVIVAEHAHHLLRLRGLGERREAAQIAEHHADVAAMALDDVVAGRDQELGDLRREEPLEPADTLDLADLIRHALLERLVPLVDLVVQFLDAQHRLHARHQRRLVDRLGQVFVGAGVEPGDDVLAVGLRGHQDDRRERHLLVRLDALGDLDAVELRHHDVEQDQVGQMLLGGDERLLAVGGLQQLVAVDAEPRDQNVAVGLVVVDDQDTRRTVHDA